MDHQSSREGRWRMGDFSNNTKKEIRNKWLKIKVAAFSHPIPSNRLNE